MGCLVSDGHTTYALTNRHVTGAVGETIYTLLNGNRVAIGTSAGRQLTRLAFRSVYPNWVGSDVYVNMDAGLIEIDDLNRWTTQVYGLGEMGEPADLNFSNLSLRVIGCQVKAYGAASKTMLGEICALFYRYKAVGGFEYVSDFLIGPRADQPWLGTHHGDSGTVWMIDLDEGRLPSPVALQWGGQPFGDGSQVSSYALATSLSTVCNQLEVDLVRGWNTGNPNYWGAVGHYSIANRATDALQNVKLKQLMTANLENVSYDDQYINKKNMQGLSNKDFVPMADVPDMVWKVGQYKRGGMTSPEHGNHFADMDRKLNTPLPGLNGNDLLEICRDDPKNVSVPVWQQYYTAVEDKSRGPLPFRVQQFYQGMVDYVKTGKVAEFVCAAGIVSHYVGDACQPLHISYLFNGDPDRPVQAMVRDPKTHQQVEGTVSYGTGVHSAYEDDMIDYHTPEVLQGIKEGLAAAQPLPLVTSNHDAAVAVVQLMQRTFHTIQPMDIVEAFVVVADQKPKPRAQAMWDQFGKATVQVMVDGCMTLAQLWESAWKAGDGDNNMTELGKVSEADLEALYQDPSFMSSHTLDTIGPLLES